MQSQEATVSFPRSKKQEADFCFGDTETLSALSWNQAGIFKKTHVGQCCLCWALSKGSDVEGSAGAQIRGLQLRLQNSKPQDLLAKAMKNSKPIIPRSHLIHPSFHLIFHCLFFIWFSMIPICPHFLPETLTLNLKPYKS